MRDKDYSKNELRLKDFIPLHGFIKYVKRNVNEGTIDSNNYANAFWHLGLIHFGQTSAILSIAKEGLEYLIK